jgi:hypothetical protein
MAYDPVKAHEYYVNYRKKGLKKGRKKGTGKSRTTGLLGVSAAGLNSDGAVEAAVIKDRLKKEMNEKLKGAKTEEEKIAIRKEYAKKANEEIAKLRSNPKFARAKATKASSSKGSSGSKSSGGSRSSGGSSKSTSARESGSSASTTTVSTTTPTTTSTTASTNNEANAQALEQVRNLTSKINEMYSKIVSLPPEQKQAVRDGIQSIVDALKKKLRK